MPDAVGNLYRTQDQTDRTYHKGGKLLKDDKYHYLYDRNGNLRLKTQRKVGQHQLKIRLEEVSQKPKKFSFFVEEVPQNKTKDLEYYLRNDRIYTQAEKEEYKRLKQAENLQTLQNDQWQRGDWAYEWNANGSLRSVKLPNGDLVQYEYDALGRRTKKVANNKIKRYLWDGNVLLHEWEYDVKDKPKKVVNKLGEVSFDKPEPVQNLITWVYETGSFVPCAKLVGNECYSVVNDYIGRPIQAYDNFGKLVWEAEYDIYGGLRNLKGDRNFVPFRQLGQYEDIETGLYYNRFRYYDCNTGTYISKDPIGLEGGLALYSYVHDSNTWVDILGLIKYIVYQAPELDADGVPTGKFYTGRTKGDDDMSVRQILDKRKSTHHRKNIGNLVSVYETDSYDAMRGGEQYYIEEARNSDIAVDQINGISPKNKKKEKYKKAFANPKNDKTRKLDNNLKNSCK